MEKKREFAAIALSPLMEVAMTLNLKKSPSGGSLMAVPKIIKVVVNMRINDAREDKTVVDSARADLEVITGQKPILCRAKKAVSGFKLRQGDPIGLKVTLRGGRMNDFLGKLSALALPRIRDFRGLSPKSFDKNGNYTIGLNVHTIFPEINIDKVKKERGMEITMVTSGQNANESRRLLESIGFAFSKE